MGDCPIPTQQYQCHLEDWIAELKLVRDAVRTRVSGILEPNGIAGWGLELREPNQYSEEDAL